MLLYRSPPGRCLPIHGLQRRRQKLGVELAREVQLVGDLPSQDLNLSDAEDGLQKRGTVAAVHLLHDDRIDFGRVLCESAISVIGEKLPASTFQSHFPTDLYQLPIWFSSELSLVNGLRISEGG